MFIKDVGITLSFGKTCVHVSKLDAIGSIYVMTWHSNVFTTA